MTSERDGQDTGAHVHHSPFTLALDLEGADDIEIFRLRQRIFSCDRCRRALEDVEHWSSALDHPNPLVAPEYLTRHGFFHDLLTKHRTHTDRLEAVDSDELFHHWGLCKLLIEESLASRDANAGYSLELGELAFAVAERLDEKFYGTERRESLQSAAADNLRGAYRLESSHSPSAPDPGTSDAVGRLDRSEPARTNVALLEAVLRKMVLRLSEAV